VSYTKSALLPVTPDEAFALLTEPERLRRWQTVSATVDLRAGGAYRWTVTPGHVAEGTYREIEPGRRVVFGWGWNGDDALPPDASTVTVVFEPAEDGTLVTLTHEGLDEVQAAAHAEGWEHFLTRLEALARTGDAGQDPWAWAPEQLDPVTSSEAVLAAIQPMLRNLTAEDRERQTPCEHFTCHDLAEHLVASLQGLGSMSGVQVDDPGEGDLENRISVLAQQAIDGWRDRGLEGTVGEGEMAFPASFAAGILPVEILLHGWDLAQASGQTLKVSDEVVAYVTTLAESMVPDGRKRGSFGDEQAAAPDASALDRLAAYAGRTPVPVR